MWSSCQSSCQSRCKAGVKQGLELDVAPTNQRGAGSVPLHAAHPLLDAAFSQAALSDKGSAAALAVARDGEKAGAGPQASQQEVRVRAFRLEGTPCTAHHLPAIARYSNEQSRNSSSVFNRFSARNRPTGDHASPCQRSRNRQASDHAVAPQAITQSPRQRSSDRPASEGGSHWMGQRCHGRGHGHRTKRAEGC